MCIHALLLPLVTPAETEEAKEIENEINRMRREIGLDPLETDKAARTAAARYAQKIAAEKRFSHIDAEGKRAVNRYRSAGGSSLIAGEILGKGSAFADVVAAWRESREHLSFILHPLWTHLGAGKAALPKGESVYVVVFTEKHLRGISASFAGGGIRIEGTMHGVEKPVAELNGAPVNMEVSKPTGDFGGSRFVIEAKEPGFLYFLRFGYMHDEGFPVFTESYRFERPDS